MRAVLDTNVVMSAIFFGGVPLKIVRAAFAKKIELVATKSVLSEYREVAERLHEQFPTVNYRRPLAILESKLTMVRPAVLGDSACRDPDDDEILACALGGAAKYSPLWYNERPPSNEDGFCLFLSDCPIRRDGDEAPTPPCQGASASQRSVPGRMTRNLRLESPSAYY